MDSAPLAESGQVRGDDEVLCFTGRIDPESSRRLIQAIDEIPPDQPITLFVRSLGGEVYAALDVAERLHPRPSTVVARSICASSCANYLLLAGDRRVIDQDAVVMWHGWLSPGFLEDRRRDLTRELRRARPDPEEVARLEQQIARISAEAIPRQSAFLQSVGADPAFFTFFDEINALPRRRWSADCASRPRAAQLVFSDRFLAQRGVPIHLNLGPDDAQSLADVLRRRNAEGVACFWD